METFKYFFTVTVGKTNVEGNVYWTNHLDWFGVVRELFLFSLLPDGVNPFQYLMESDTVIITKSVGMDYKKQIYLADTLCFKLNTANFSQCSLDLILEIENQHKQIIAVGRQKIAFAKLNGTIKRIPENLKSKAKNYEKIEED